MVRDGAGMACARDGKQSELVPRMIAVPSPTVAEPDRARRARRLPPAAACCAPRPRRCSISPRSPRRALRALRRDDRRDPRPGGGHRHGQERPCRPQDRRHLRLDRHAGALRASGRGQPRRSRHDHRDRSGARPVELGRDAGARRHRGLHPARLDPAAGDRRPRRQHARRHRRPRAGPAAPRRGLPDGPGADHLDHRDPGARRRAGDRPARAPRLRHAGVQRAASGRQPRQEADPGRAADASRRRAAAGARCTRR